jgi:hypothetical protein
MNVTLKFFLSCSENYNNNKCVAERPSCDSVHDDNGHHCDDDISYNMTTFYEDKHINNSYQFNITKE